MYKKRPFKNLMIPKWVQKMMKKLWCFRVRARGNFFSSLVGVTRAFLYTFESNNCRTREISQLWQMKVSRNRAFNCSISLSWSVQWPQNRERRRLRPKRKKLITLLWSHFHVCACACNRNEIRAKITGIWIILRACAQTCWWICGRAAWIINRAGRTTERERAMCIWPLWAKLQLLSLLEYWQIRSPSLSHTGRWKYL